LKKELRKKEKSQKVVLIVTIFLNTLHNNLLIMKTLGKLIKTCNLISRRARDTFLISS